MPHSLETDNSKGSFGKNAEEANVFVIESNYGDINLRSYVDVSSFKFEKASPGKGQVEAGDDHDPKSIELKRTCQQRFLGMGLMVVASMCFSMSVTIVKMLNKYEVFSIGVWRFGGGCFMPSVLVLVYYELVKKSQPFQTIYPMFQLDKFKTLCILLVRAVTGTGGIMLQFNALKYISVSDTTVIAFSSPVFVTFLACLLLGESFGVMNVLAALLTLIGVGIITRPSFLTGTEMDSNVMIGVGLAMSAMILAIFIFLSLRMLNAVNFAVVNLFFGIVGTIFCYIMSEILGSFELPHSTWDWFLCAVLCSLTFGGLVFQTVAFKYEDAGPLSLCRSFDVIFSFIWQGIFLSVIPDKYSIIGSFVVLIGVLLIGFRKHLISLPEDHQCRKTCCCILK